MTATKTDTSAAHQSSHYPVFEWSDDYNIGIDSIDGQHRHLVQLINRLSSQLLQDSLTHAARQHYLQELVDYAHYHFEEEERYMQAAGLDARFIATHRLSHQSFARQLAALAPEVEHDSDAAMGALLQYLYHWLMFHILGRDHAIGEQVALIAAGTGPAQAAERTEDGEDDAHTGPLLQALGVLFELLGDKNRELREINATLEQRVADRTQALDRLNHQLEALSQTDALAGLPNRRHLLERLGQFCESDQSTGQPLACLMIDADHFKEVNDRDGHAAGDLVLKALGQALRDTARTDDIVARLGGDEFCILCPATSHAGAMALAEELLAVVRSLHVQTGAGNRWNASISIGVAVSNGVQHADELLRLADEGLYAAKQAGRSCVRSVQAA